MFGAVPCRVDLRSRSASLDAAQEAVTAGAAHRHRSVLKRRSCRHRGGDRARRAHDKTCVRDGGELGRGWWAENASRYGRAGPRRAPRRNRALRTNRRNRRPDSPSPNTTRGLGTGALTQHSVLRGSMNSERPPESASSTPTGPGGSDGLREGPGYFLFESRRPFEHVTCVPRARPQQGQHASPAGRSHRRPRRRQGGKGWQGRRQGRWQGWWPWRTRPALRRRPQRPIYSVRAGGATAAEVRPPATSHGVERRRDGLESRHQVCHDRGREARGDGCARPALRRRPQRPAAGRMAGTQPSQPSAGGWLR